MYLGWNVDRSGGEENERGLETHAFRYGETLSSIGSGDQHLQNRGSSTSQEHLEVGFEWIEVVVITVELRFARNTISECTATVPGVVEPIVDLFRGFPPVPRPIDL